MNMLSDNLDSRKTVIGCNSSNLDMKKEETYSKNIQRAILIYYRDAAKYFQYRFKELFENKGYDRRNAYKTNETSHSKRKHQEDVKTLNI